jgi:MSHA pilin protein MshA
MTNSRGFTLIELVVTLSVVAILAAVALPRYIALQQQARVAKAQAIYGGVRSAAALAHAQAMATSTTMSGAATVSMEGVNVTLNNGYPTGDAAGITTALQISDVSDSVVTASGGGTLTIDVNGGTSPNCRVTYVEPAAANGSPTITVAVGGC